MHILVYHNSYRQPGGEDHVFREEAQMLESRGHRVTRVEVSNHDIHERRALNTLISTSWNTREYRRVFEMVSELKPDIVHVHNDFALASPAVYHAARKAGATVVHTLHNFRNLCANGLLFRDNRVCEDCLDCGSPMPGVTNRCYRGSLPASLAVAGRTLVHRHLGTYKRVIDQFIAPTQLVKDLHVRGGFPEDRIAVKPHFVPRQPETGNGRGGYALFVGRLTKEKGLDVLLKAWRQVPDHIPLWVVGSGEMRPDVLAASDQFKHIRFLGPQPPDKVHGLMADALCTLVPSPVYESFGRVTIESFSHGTPVIASAHGASAELIDHGSTGYLVEPGNETLLADRVTQSAHDLSGDRMRKACRDTYMRRYTEQANYTRLVKIYEDARRRSCESGDPEGAGPRPLGLMPARRRSA